MTWTEEKVCGWMKTLFGYVGISLAWIFVIINAMKEIVRMVRAMDLTEETKVLKALLFKNKKPLTQCQAVTAFLLHYMKLAKLEHLSRKVSTWSVGLRLEQVKMIVRCTPKRF
jgi:hypothetical protein